MPPVIRDVQGENDYPPEACQLVVWQFQGIIDRLWEDFLNIKEAKPRKHIFDDLDKFFANAFGNCLLFTAESITESPSSVRQRYRIRKWCYNNSSIRPSLSKKPRWAESFESRLLDKAQSSVKPLVVPYEKMSEDDGHLGKKLENLGITPIWFDHGGVLLLGVSLLSNAQDREVWKGWMVRLLEFFPELLATPLRIGSHHSQLRVFQGACRDGVATEVERLGQSILLSRIRLAWRAADVKRSNQTVEPRILSGQKPPEVSGEYDAVVANYLDAKRFVAVAALDSPRGQQPTDAVEDVRKGFLPSEGKGGHRLFLSAPSGSEPRESSFIVAQEATLARHAIGRSLRWMEYKTGYLDEAKLDSEKCPFPHEHETHEGCEAWLREDHGKDMPPLDNVIHPDSIYTSWLRYLWVEVFYCARHIRENRRESSGDLLTKLAGKYAHAVEVTRPVFPAILAARQAAERPKAESEQKGDLESKEESTQGPDTGLKVDWRWLYLWFLANATSSQQLQEAYGSYIHGKHGFKSHLDHYRDASTAVLFGLHLVRFWDGAKAMELWDLPELRPDEVMQARLRLLCEYAYWEIGVNRAWQLEHHLGAQFQPEMILQATSSAHREHVLHVMDVCLLGHLLVSSYEGTEGSPSKFCETLLQVRTEKEFLRLWYPAALLHDLGRAQEIALSFPEMMGSLNTPDLTSFAKAVTEGIDGANRTLDKAIIEQFKGIGLPIAEPTDGIGRDHGVISANHLIHSLGQTAGDAGFLKTADTKTILLAIARHNRRRDSFAASAEPLSYLLVICDHLQDWSRPRFTSQRLAMGFLGWSQLSSPVMIKGQRAAQWLSPCADYRAEQNAIVFKGNDICLTLEYEPSRSSLLEPACLWVGMTADIERVWFDDGYPVVEIVFVHPRSEVLTHSHSGAYEMELLRDFAMTEDGAFLSSWLGSVAGEDGMSHSIDPDKETERFCLRLGTRRMDAPKLLNSIPKRFYSQFVEWKKRQLRLADEE
jgi:hypothetical protein